MGKLSIEEKHVVWVMGASAAGKETFIRRAASDAELAGRFGWAGRLVVPCQASLEYIAQSPDDSITNKREKILQQVPQLLEKAGVVLIKWQMADSTANRPARLQESIPSVAHGAIVLSPPESEMPSRLEKKAWWSTYGKPGWTEQELPYIADAIENLPASFNVRYVNSSSAGNYEPAQAYQVKGIDAGVAVYPGAAGDLITAEV